MVPEGFPVCDAHRQAAAPWRCDRCARNLCESCAVAVPAGRDEIPGCTFCGGLAAPVLVPRAKARPFRTEMRGAAVQALSARGVALVAVVTCATQCVSWLGRDGWVIGNLFVFAWALSCSRRAARGFPAFRIPSYADLGATAVSLARLALSAGFLGAGAFWIVDGGSRSGSFAAALLLGAFAIWLLPPALIDAVVEDEDHRLLWPWGSSALARRLGGDVFPIRVAVAGFVVFAILQTRVPPPDFHTDVDLLAHLTVAAALRFAAVLGLAMAASLAGLLVFTRGEELGHGDPESYRVPAFPDARPKGVSRPRAP